MSDLDDLVLDLIKTGFVQEACTLVEATGGMSEDEQNKQYRFFRKAVANAGEYVDDDSVNVDPKKKIISFEATSVSLIKFPIFLDRLLHSLNSVGNSTYSLGKVRRGRRTVVEITVGK